MVTWVTWERVKWRSDGVGLEAGLKRHWVKASVVELNKWKVIDRVSPRAAFAVAELSWNSNLNLNRWLYSRSLVLRAALFAFLRLVVILLLFIRTKQYFPLLPFFMGEGCYDITSLLLLLRGICCMFLSHLLIFVSFSFPHFSQCGFHFCLFSLALLHASTLL